MIRMKLFTLTLTALVFAITLAQAQDKAAKQTAATPEPMTASISPRLISTEEVHKLETSGKDVLDNCVDHNPIYVRRLNHPQESAKLIRNYEVSKDRKRITLWAQFGPDEAGVYGVFFCKAGPPSPGDPENGKITVEPKAVVEKLQKMPKDYQPDITALKTSLATATEELRAAKAKIAEIENRKTDLSPVEGRIKALEDKPVPPTLTPQEVDGHINDRVAPLERKVEGLANGLDDAQKGVGEVRKADALTNERLAELASSVRQEAVKPKRYWLFWKKPRSPYLAGRAEAVENSANDAANAAKRQQQN